ncbi:uncharacterized protein BO95DRAFT_439048 [Aspergillus brunneoviolaceus CBS 621.78]|uniref:Uncharacterized protein n=1 Tax=Aspergillus brunneoviolaceus CBS 621.78 TaxID=1450534 RepID=A0ACD1GKY5_9EURO|nr:hypothetical protein BO95DRAFT_439048 [Aspergillus brunneoviolaceus CBS 621.78]RAH49840.1 hypothetical protein BO95DRAFT_439048 [Aspergillus brunneoviolaceus CBS 621.78]
MTWHKESRDFPYTFIPTWLRCDDCPDIHRTRLRLRLTAAAAAGSLVMVMEMEKVWNNGRSSVLSKIHLTSSTL